MLSEHLTADKMMVPFQIYVLKKSTKYGIKVYALVDVTSNYIINFEIYVGQQPGGNFWINNLPTDVIIRMIDPVRNNGRTITMDNYFTLLSLFWALKKNMDFKQLEPSIKIEHSYHHFS